jgi:hypothetical protein
VAVGWRTCSGVFPSFTRTPFRQSSTQWSASVPIGTSQGQGIRAPFSIALATMKADRP